MRILITPDKFKHALDAFGVARAMAAGVSVVRPDDTITLQPLADGGEGTAQVLAAATAADQHGCDVHDPIGRPRRAQWWLTRADRTALLEMSAASGLHLLAEPEANPLHTSSFGTGQILRTALAAGATRVLLGVGGSATVDGGAGCLQAMGWHLIDRNGHVLASPMTGGNLADIARVEPPTERWKLPIDVLCDVTNPLLGPLGAAPVFAPQKGARPADVAVLERGLENWADVLARDCGRDVRDLFGSGAAGGLSAGLAAACGARLQPGFECVAQRVGLADMLAQCDLCLTGEGRLDDQTAGGKVVSGVARLAAQARVPIVAFVGQARLAPGQTLEQLATSLGLRTIVIITPPGTPLEQALSQTATNLERCVRSWSAGFAEEC